eukprot:Gb_10603 [translate_table: standard]
MDHIGPLVEYNDTVVDVMTLKLNEVVVWHTTEEFGKPKNKAVAWPETERVQEAGICENDVGKVSCKYIRYAHVVCEQYARSKEALVEAKKTEHHEEDIRQT